MRTRSLNHSCYKHLYHIVWGTRYRYKYLKTYVATELLKSFEKTCSLYPTLHIETFNTDADHIHIQIEIPPNIAVSRAVQVLKQNSSRHLKKKFPFIRKLYLEKGIWSVGFYSSTNGLNEEQVRRYIEWQGKKDYPKNQLNLEFS